MLYRGMTDCPSDHPDELLLKLRTHRLHYLEQAALLHALHTRCGCSWAELSGQTGWPVQLMVNRAQLMALDAGLRQALMAAGAPERIALFLTRLPDEVTRRRIARAILRERLCIRDAWLLVEAALHRQPVQNAPPLPERRGRVISLVRDHRPYVNAIRDIAGQMQSAGLQATLTEKQSGRKLEVTLAMSLRRRRVDRHQSMQA